MKVQNETIALVVAGAVTLLAWLLWFTLVFTSPNFAELFVGGGSGLALGVLLRPILLAQLDRRAGG